MTVAIVCTVPDGVILGVDSAVTIGDASNPLKVYEDAEKYSNSATSRSELLSMV